MKDLDCAFSNPSGESAKKASIRRLSLLASILLLMTALGYFGFIRAGLFLESVAQAPVPSDLIVSLGGDWGERSEKAAALYRLGYAKHVLLTGALSLPQRPGKPLQNSRLQLLLNCGVPGEAIFLDPLSASTREEAINTLSLMKKQVGKTC